MSLFLPLKEAILDILFPITCIGCEREGRWLCPECERGLSWIPPICFVCRKFSPGRKKVSPGRTCDSCQTHSAVYAFLSPFSYADTTIRECIHRLKYNRSRVLALLFGEFLGRYCTRYGVVLPSSALVVPIPLHPRRMRVRGFNQAALIARAFAASQGLRDDDMVLERVRNTLSQVTLTAEARRENVKEVFRVWRPVGVKNRTVVLVDDVTTSGATIEEAACALKEAGVLRVWAVTVAH